MDSSQRNDTFKSISGPAEGLYKEKGSKFLAFAYPVVSEEEVRAALEKIRKEYYDARHGGTTMTGSLPPRRAGRFTGRFSRGN